MKMTGTCIMFWVWVLRERIRLNQFSDLFGFFIFREDIVRIWIWLVIWVKFALSSLLIFVVVFVHMIYQITMLSVTFFICELPSFDHKRITNLANCVTWLWVMKEYFPHIFVVLCFLVVCCLHGWIIYWLLRSIMQK